MNAVSISLDATDETTGWFKTTKSGENHVAVHVKGTWSGTLTVQTKQIADANADAVSEAETITSNGHHQFLIYGPVMFRLYATTISSGTVEGTINAE